MQNVINPQPSPGKNETRFLSSFDLGTNTLLALTAAAGSAGNPTELCELCKTTRLGENLDQTGLLSRTAMEKTLSVLREFLRKIRSENSPGIGIAAATNAVREASNRNEFLEMFRNTVGGTPLVLPGKEEAKTAFLGATRDQPPDCFILNVDVGGGSTELSAGFPENCIFAKSVNVGCVKLTERFNLNDEAPHGAVEAAAHAVSESLQPICTKTRALDPETPGKVVASGGTATTLAAIQLHLESYHKNRIHGLRMDVARIETILERISSMTAAERAAVPGIPPDRAAVFPAGVLILSRILRLLNIRQFTVTARGLRYGLICRLHAGDFRPTWSW